MDTSHRLFLSGLLLHLSLPASSLFHFASWHLLLGETRLEHPSISQQAPGAAMQPLPAPTGTGEDGGHHFREE